MSGTVRSLESINAGSIILQRTIGSEVLSFSSDVVLARGTYVDVMAYGVRCVGRIVTRKKMKTGADSRPVRTYTVQSLGNFACSRMVRATSVAEAGTGFANARSMTLSYIVRLASKSGVTIQELLQFISDNISVQCFNGTGVNPVLKTPPMDYGAKSYWLMGATFASVFSETVARRYPRMAYRFIGGTIEVFDRDSTPVHTITEDQINASEISEDISDCATVVRLESVNAKRCTKQVTVSPGSPIVKVPGIVNEDAIPTDVTEVSVAPGTEYEQIGLDRDFDEMVFSVTVGSATLNVAVGQDIRKTVEVQQSGWLYDKDGLNVEAGFIDEDFGIIDGGTDGDRNTEKDMQDIVQGMHQQLSVPVVGGDLAMTSLRADILPGDRVIIAADHDLDGLVIDVAGVTHAEEGTKVSLTAMGADFMESKRAEYAAADYARNAPKRGGLK